MKNGKEIEAIYLASESGLTKRFSPVALLKSFLQNSKKNASNILKNGNNNLSAMVCLQFIISTFFSSICFTCFLRFF